MDFKALWLDILKGENFVLIPHINPDADGIGCAMAMYWKLKEHGKKCTLFNASTDMPQELDFLNGFDKFVHKLPEKFDTAISFDSAKFDRLGISRGDFRLISIDHHISNDLYADVNILDVTAQSATTVVYKLLEAGGEKITKDMANALFTGLITDTGFFSNEDVCEDTFEYAKRMVSCGADPSYVSSMLTKREPLSKLRVLAMVLESLELECDGKVSFMYLSEEMLKKSGATRSQAEEFAHYGRDLATVDVGVFLREWESGNIRASIRSKGSFDANEFASNFGGGGHKKAAGIMFKSSTLNEAKEKILEKLREYLK